MHKIFYYDNWYFSDTTVNAIILYNDNHTPDGTAVKFAATVGGTGVGSVGAAVGGVAVGAAIGSVVPGIGTIIGGAVGGIAAGIGGATSIL